MKLILLSIDVVLKKHICLVVHLIKVSTVQCTSSLIQSHLSINVLTEKACNETDASESERRERSHLQAMRIRPLEGSTSGCDDLCVDVWHLLDGRGAQR